MFFLKIFALKETINSLPWLKTFLKAFIVERKIQTKIFLKSGLRK